MLWKIKKPCEHCPFRSDKHPFISSERAKELAKRLSNDTSWFACHDTTGVKKGKKVKPEKQSHCMGAAIMLFRAGLINVATRLALVLELITIKELKAPVPVFNTPEEFVAHHEGN